MENLTKLLAENQVFGSLSSRERAQMIKQAQRRKLARGEWLAHYDAVWPYLFIVVSGAIYGVKESLEGRSLIVLALEPGALFWGMAFFENESPLLIGLQAQEDCEVVLWSREQLRPLLWGNGRFSWELSRLLALRMQQGGAFMEDLAFRPVRDRLARLLLERYGEAVDEFVTRDLTLDEMAAHIGTKREVVCRMLYRFEDEGMVEVRRKAFMITDHKKLTDLAQMPSES